MKKLISLALASILAFTLLGCGGSGEPKTFSRDGFSVTLTDRFEDISNMPEVAQFSAAYSSDRDGAGVFVTKEPFTLFDHAGISVLVPLVEYAEMMIENNGHSTSVVENDGLTYFVYDFDTGDGVFRYFSSVYRGNDAFWIAQFYTTADRYSRLESDFIAWAQSVDVGFFDAAHWESVYESRNEGAGTIFGSSPMDFSCEGFTITLTESFFDYSGQPGFTDFTMVVVSEHSGIGVMVEREDFASFDMAGVSTDISLYEYAEMTAGFNGIDSEIIESDGLTYFSHEWDAYTYVVCVYRGHDAYYILNLYCYTDDFGEYESELLRIAKTVRV